MAVQTRWEPTALEMQIAMTLVLSDVVPDGIDALLIHRSPVRDDKLDDELLRYVRSRYSHHKRNGDRTPGITRFVLNGITDEECESINLAYCGCERWKLYLLSAGVDPADIELLLPSPHTGAESRAFLLLKPILNYMVAYSVIRINLVIICHHIGHHGKFASVFNMILASTLYQKIDIGRISAFC